MSAANQGRRGRVLPDDERFMQEAVAEAQKGLAEGGIPIGAVLVIDGEIVARGHNRRVQQNSPILHGETDCFAQAGRLKASDYRRATMYTTLTPCDMCSGTILLYKVPRVVIGEDVNFTDSPQEYLKSRGVELTILDDSRCKLMMEAFIKDRPELWFEDIGV